VKDKGRLEYHSQFRSLCASSLLYYEGFSGRQHRSFKLLNWITRFLGCWNFKPIHLCDVECPTGSGKPLNLLITFVFLPIVILHKIFLVENNQSNRAQVQPIADEARPEENTKTIAPEDKQKAGLYRGL